MKRVLNNLLFITALTTLLLATTSFIPKFETVSKTDTIDKMFSIIPEPVRILPGTNQLIIDKNTIILAQGEDELKSANFLKEYIDKHYDLKLEIVQEKMKARRSNKMVVRFIDLNIGTIAYDIAGFNPSDLKKEGAYILSVADGVISLKGANSQGLFCSVQTFLQLLPCSKPTPDTLSGQIKLTVNEVNIADFPRFGYRGMHLDVVRHFFPVDYIKRYIDYLALHKMNYFHWHLTDDQGWRIESKIHPRLNEFGSWRAGTIIGLFPGTGVDSVRYGGYYTQDQIREIIKYADERYITIVPEIDIPGHSMAILAAYPQFSTTPEVPKAPAITWGIFNRQNNVLAPSEELFVFLEEVFNELMDLFPGEYIHIGADECSKIWWKESEATQQFMKRYGIADEDELQAYFVKRVSDVIKSRSRKTVGWDEILEGHLPEGSVVMGWRKAEYGWKAAEMGYKAILTPNIYSYLNVAQKPDEDTLCHNRYLVTLDSVYNFEPVPEWFSEYSAANILGGQGCMWTEYFPTVARLEYALFPRFSAISEVYWSQKRVKNLSRFREKLLFQFKRYELWGTNYSKAILEEKK